ncbi:MAG: hypothetical protein ACRETL_00215, partial [Gammaproteobacteria bacterium]
MANIRIECVPVKPFALGWFGFDHLQLVFEPDCAGQPVPQDDWFVLEGSSGSLGRKGAAPTLTVLGADGRTTLAAANHAASSALVRRIGTPTSRGSHILPVACDPDDAWQAMSACARAINEAGLPYRLFGVPGTPYPSITSSSIV